MSVARWPVRGWPGRGGSCLFPNRQISLPLSRSSALVWDIEYEGRRLESLPREDTTEMEDILVRKEREILFYRKHLRNKERIWDNWYKHTKKFGFPVMERMIKILRYGSLVLKRVVSQLEKQRLGLEKQIRRKRDGNDGGIHVRLR
ncbi:hypothetical protein F5Y19DRAFT_439100 [Xylariaceae sp. FL1651]|nr:hypothetical protein F5Y19DRAFT_439100 [Xylariaceae sp. FL1651]